MEEGINAKVDEQREHLAEVEAQLQEKRDLSLKSEGLFFAYSGLYAELEQLKKELEVLKNSSNATPREVDCKEL